MVQAWGQASYRAFAPRLLHHSSVSPVPGRRRREAEEFRVTVLYLVQPTIRAIAGAIAAKSNYYLDNGKEWLSTYMRGNATYIRDGETLFVPPGQPFFWRSSAT